MGHSFSRKSDPYNPNAPTTSSSKKSSKKKQQPLRPPPTITMACSGQDEPSQVEEPDLKEDKEKIDIDSRILNSLKNERAKELLRLTWCDDFGVLYDLGTDIYSEIFRLNPNIKRLFKELDSYDLEQDPNSLRQCSAFSKQALRFVQTISMVVQHNAHLKTIDEYLKDIGRRHVQFKRIGFECAHWQIFETAIANVMEARVGANTKLDESDREILAEAYRQLSGHIVATMTVGFRQEESSDSKI